MDDRLAGITRMSFAFLGSAPCDMPFARLLLLALSTMQDNDAPTTQRMLKLLTSEFPNNKLYREALLKLK